MASKILKSISLDIELAAWVEEQATAENRSFANFVQTLLIKQREESEAATKQPEPETVEA